MRTLLGFLGVFVFFLSSCRETGSPTGYPLVTDEDTPQNNFNVLWTDFDRNYPVFDLNHIDWDSLYSRTLPGIKPNTSPDSLFTIMKTCILALEDAHSDLMSSRFGSCGYYNTFAGQKPRNYISWDLIVSKYVDVAKSNGGHLAYGTIRSKNIGYFFVGSFGDNQNDYYMMDSLLAKSPDMKGLIIDARQNAGGNESYAQVVASRLTARSVVYRYARTRNGPGHSDLSDFLPLTLNPGGPAKFTGPVVLLTSRRTFSAGEDFTLMLRSLDNVIHIGDTTFGGVATNPAVKILPNGWSYRMSRTVNCDRYRNPIKGGIPPRVVVAISKEDSTRGNDTILEKAIDIINEELTNRTQDTRCERETRG